jgi:hypothetical protein
MASEPVEPLTLPPQISHSPKQIVFGRHGQPNHAKNVLLAVAVMESEQTTTPTAPAAAQDTTPYGDSISRGLKACGTADRETKANAKEPKK